MHSFDFPQKCTQCGNLKTFPYSWSITSPPMMCNCTSNNPLGKKPKHWKKFDPKNYPVVNPFVTDDLKLKKLLFKDDM